MADHREVLREIRTFPQLIKFLRDELDWPINSEDFEEMTFEYTPEELGIDAASAAKIEKNGIKRLRPLSPNQPWGIFFIKFEPKKLPIVALRRILSRVALKKRASANSAERTAWAADDLLFVSNYGEGDERQISFAHFSQAMARQDLPTLKVLGWDNLDTALHLDAVAKELTQHLAWPADDADIEGWRKNWRSAFTLRHREVIITSRDLSIRLAELARAIRDRIKTAIAIETEKGSITKLMKAFQEALVHDLDVDGFADMYSQTIAYGLLSARIADPHNKTADDFAGQMRTNPFLHELMETFLKVGGRRGKAGGPGIDFDELGVSEVVELLDNANMEAVVRDFGDRNPQEDPVIHFYELFLNEYDKQQKVSRGVFYTPRPVVSYIVRSVHELLETEFGLADGLADTATWGEMVKRHAGLAIPEGVKHGDRFITVLDPGTGTGTFLVEAIEIIHRTLVEKWKREGHNESKILDLWNDYVPRHLLPRLHGYELLMAPYAIAHLKVGLKLHETGYRFESDERARIYLTNALEPAHDFSGTLAFAIPALAHEAEAVNKVKQRQRFTIVIGNPPYSNFGQLNRIPVILELLEDYKRGLDERKINLDDDFIKFLRFSQHLLEQAAVGVFGMISNNSFLDGVTHRQMRHSLGQSYHRISVLNLHGSATLGESCPDGSTDENVFDIRQGVAITFGVRRCATDASHPHLYYGDLWGLRDHKYKALARMSVSAASTLRLSFLAEYYFFVPKDFGEQGEYDAYFPVRGVFATDNTGIQTKRDSLTIHFTPAELHRALEDLMNLSDRDLRARYELPVDGRDWQVASAKADVGRSIDEERMCRILYRPFDWRWTYFTGKTKGFLAYPRRETMLQMLQPNLAIVTLRINGGGEEFVMFVADCLVEKGSLPRGNYSIFPLYCYPDPRAVESTLQLHNARRASLNGAFVRDLGAGLALSHRPGYAMPEGVTPEDVFQYAYAVFHSFGYRIRYAEFLKIDFPRLPLTSSLNLFRELARLGGELVALHLLKSSKLDETITEFIGGRNPEVEKVSWSKDTVWIDRALANGFKGVREHVWKFHIGGYQVCEKWLKDRKGRALSNDDIAHYQKIVVALAETIRLMKEIDDVIEAHGGWPGAFLKSAP
jgi:predicted helicase